ncbi:prostacyclin synthase-like [Scleropages formosus]|uniref:Prostacyclin synthase n=1 Tax=Scleropages formosus TaxID=113540 RepID=A0A0P7TDW5_SCLFO|nr:prostacyclin synthase-like [Scleropages formosus]
MWTLLLALASVLLLIRFLLIFASRTRSNDEPPLDKGLIPWLGYALEFRKDAAKFLSEMKKKHGDIFTVRAAGHYITVLLDPNSYDEILNNSDSLVYSGQKVTEKVFSLDLTSHNRAEEKRWMQQRFHGENLDDLSRSMYKNLQVLLRSAEIVQKMTEWKQDQLFNFCYSLLFKAGYLTLFDKEHNGSSVDLAAIYKEFRTFDGLLAKMARSSLKSGEKQVAFSVRKRLWDLLSQTMQNGSGSSRSWQQDYRQLLEENGMDKEAQRRAMLLQLWVTQCNAGPAAFWLLGFLLTHPEAMRAVRREIDDLLQQGGASQGLPLDKKAETPVFDSVLSETLRLTAAVLISREVKQDTMLELVDGRKYRLRRGDRVCLFPYLSPQMDPSIHDEPEVFKFDRFLNADGTKKTDFFQGKSRLKYYTMPWGAGMNICVGRDFAISAIKQFVFMVLTCFDMELSDPDSSMPPSNTIRCGFGMLQPEGDLNIRYKRKALL